MALAAVAAAEYGYGKQTVDYSHVPYYNFDWKSLGEGKGYGYGSDDYGYGEVLNYGQYESRSKDDTKTNWWTELPGKSHIKRDDIINAQQHVSYSKGYGGDYKSNDYKMDSYKKY